MTSPLQEQSSARVETIGLQLRHLFEKGQTVELRVPKGGRDGTILGYFNNGRALAEAAAQLSGNYAGVYVTLNPVDPGLLARSDNRLQFNADRGLGASDDDILRRRWLLVDADPVRPADVSATDAEHDLAIDKAVAVREYLTAEGWPAPILADSGNGAHLLYRVDLPNDESSKALVRGVLQRLAQLFDDDAVKIDRKVFNASRICKLYGTQSRKGEASLERPHRTAAMIDSPTAGVVPVELMAALQPVEPERPKPAPVVPPANQRARRYAMSALDSACNNVAQAQPGTRNDTLNNEAFNIAQLVAGGELAEAFAWAAIEAAALGIGLDENEVRATMLSAFEAGKQQPRSAPESTRQQQRPAPQRQEVTDPETGEVTYVEAPANDNSDQPNRYSDYHPPTEASAPPVFADPIDILSLTMPPLLPLEVLPDALIEYVQDQSTLLGCDRGIIGMSALVSAAACITDSIRLQPKRHDPTWRESARLWLAVVGDPSTRKSPAIDKAVRHIKRLDGDMADRNMKEQAQHKAQFDEWKELNREAKKSGSPLPAPEKPAMQRLLVEDTTVEALSEILKDNPRGVLCLKDELTGWFASMDAYKGANKGASMDRAHWLEAYNGGRRSIDRVTRGSIVIPNWSVCMIGGIQDEMIRRVASTMGHDGLLQRFMVVCARPAVPDEDRSPDMRAMERYKDLFTHLSAITPPSGDVVTMTEPAHQSRERVSDYARKMIAAFDHPHMRAWLGKWDGLFARLVLLYHVIDCASRGVYPTTEQVPGSTATRVEALLCGYLLHHAIHFYSEILDANEQMEHTRQLARLILAKRFERVTKRDMAIAWKASRKLEDWELGKITNTLCNYGWLEPDQGSAGGDKRVRAWHVNPAVHAMFAGHAERESARRRDATEAIKLIRESYAGRDPDDPESY